MLGGFIGVDFSDGRVKTVTVTRGLKGTELRKASFEGEPGSAEVKAFIQGQISLGTRVVAGISSSPLLLRVLKFPFSDSKKLRRVYRFELENSTGFSLGEDVLSDYHEVGSSEGAEIIVPAFGKEAFESYLGLLRGSGVEPDQATLSAVAFSSLESSIEGERPLLLIDLDQEHLNFSLFDEGGLSRVRNCDDAVERMRNALSSNSLDFRLINDQEERRREFFENCSMIAEEVRNTARYFESESGKEIKSLVITGEVCKVNGISESLGEHLGREVKTVFIPELGEKDSPVFAKAYALALYGNSSGRGGLNLIRNLYRPSGIAKGLLREFRLPVALFAALFLVVAFARVTEGIYARSEINSLRSEMERDLREEFPQAVGTQDPVAFYREELQVINRKLKLLKQVKGTHSPLEVLRAVSATIPKGVSFSIDEIRIEDGGKTKIRGKSSSYEEIASIEKAFSESGSFSQVKVGQAGKAVNDSLKFEISMVAN